ncbi:histidine kinase [Xylanimonas cellulosilytica DSM 15894]|uniref:histidine kinase n=1 Tax=Xylanimonas cellulosilytica (strain DSM 15894 / JCM 12276 / CECT 5975 / KCTC 9989 / LMG 20990 / NBRC 107835 / XIL07) TaxID=446471 RepID=D1BZA0_XYLCX|nr:histidine kinase [Xylanimonas cellulosilytica DSM 15894]
MLVVLVLGAALLGRWVRRLRAHVRERSAEAERLRALAKERADRVSVLAHEIRTPLALVKGAGELLAERTPGALNDIQSTFVETITQNTEAVIAMAEDLLTEARLEADLFTLQLEETDLRHLVRRTVRELRQVNQMSISLDSRGAPVTVMVDRRLMRQALWNLVTNAGRHAGSAAPVVVRITPGEESVLVAVSDAGRGMDADERRDLFTPFAPHHRGTGLGLVITRRIVELHGGRVFVDTVARRGTTVLLSVPVVAR